MKKERGVVKERNCRWILEKEKKVERAAVQDQKLREEEEVVVGGQLEMFKMNERYGR